MSSTDISEASVPEIEGLAFSKKLGTEVVKIIVGKGENVKHFVIHRALLTERSETFTTIFKDASTKTAILPDDHATVFNALVEWLYHDRFMTIKRIDPTSTPSSQAQHVQLLSIAHLASKYSIWELLDRTTAGYVQCMRINYYLPSIYEMRYAYNNFPPDSRIRRFVAMAAAYIIQSMANDHDNGTWENAHFQSAFGDLGDFLLDVLDVLRNRAGRLPRDPRMAPPCEWHDHTARVGCPWGERDVKGDTWEV